MKLYRTKQGEIWSYTIMCFLTMRDDGLIDVEQMEFAHNDRTGHYVNLAPYDGDVTTASKTGILG